MREIFLFSVLSIGIAAVVVAAMSLAVAAAMAIGGLSLAAPVMFVLSTAGWTLFVLDRLSVR